MPQHWPAFILGLIIASYWARVLRLVFKARRRTGRDANFVPPELLGRLLRVIWYPVVLLWVIVPFVFTYWRNPPTPLRQLLRPLHAAPWLTWAALAIAIAAFVATLVCWKKMGKSWRMGIDPGEKTQLIFTGPYAFVRHPIYALSSLLMICSAIIVPAPLMLLLAAVHLLFLQWEARREEKYLVSLHGAGYEHYRAQVGRFIPRSLRAYGS